MKNILKQLKQKASKEERRISTAIALSIVVMTLTFVALSKSFPSPEVAAVILISEIMVLICFVVIWLVTTANLKNRPPENKQNNDDN